MKTRDKDYFRKLLLKERQRVLEELGWLEKNYLGKSAGDSTGKVSSYSVHPADMGTDSMEMEKAYLIGAATSKVFEDIDDALRKIDSESYGLCENCGVQISTERLEAVPYAKFCITCKANLEKSGGRST